MELGKEPLNEFVLMVRVNKLVRLPIDFGSDPVIRFPATCKTWRAKMSPMLEAMLPPSSLEFSKSLVTWSPMHLTAVQLQIGMSGFVPVHDHPSDRDAFNFADTAKSHIALFS